MNTQRLALVVFLLSIPAFAKDVTYRLTGAEPLTFTIPDDWSSGWSPIMSFHDDDPDAPVDLISFTKPPSLLQEETPEHRRDHSPALLIDARHKLIPLSEMKMQLREFDEGTQTIIPAKELHSQADRTLIGYYNIRINDRPGQNRLDAFWNLGTRTWTANIRFPADQTDWEAPCVAIIESVRLADPDTAPPTPKRPTINGVEDPDVPEAAMEEWRKQHE